MKNDKTADARLRVCLKNSPGIRGFRFGVPPLGGSKLAPPEGGTPNGILRHALRSPRPVFFDGQFIGCTQKTFRELRAAAKQARQCFKEERGILQGLRLLKKAYALRVGRRTQGHRNLRTAVARQKAKTGFYRKLWHSACLAAERTATHVILPSVRKPFSTL